MSKKVLGKGLGALLATQETFVEEKSDILDIPIQSIEPNSLQPRKVFDEGKLAELAESIKEKGLIQPIVVTRKHDNQFEIIVGERRWRACQRLGLKKIPAIVKEASNYEKLELALIENLQRQDLNPIEEAISYKELLDNLKLTQEELSNRIGKNRTTIANTLRLLKLPESVQKEITHDHISEGHGRSLLALKDKEKIEKAKNKVIAEGLSVRQTEKLVQQLNEEENINKDLPEYEEKAQKQNDGPDDVYIDIEDDSYILNVEKNLNALFQTEVKLKRKSGRENGKIEIKYQSTDELNRILHDILGIK